MHTRLRRSVWLVISGLLLVALVRMSAMAPLPSLAEDNAPGQAGPKRADGAASHVSPLAHLPLVLNGAGRSASLAEPLPLKRVAFWAYQIQGLEEEGAVDALAASCYDMLVLEPTRTDAESANFDTRGMVQRLKGSLANDGVHRKLVIAYVNIAEAEDWRWYWTWSQDWDCRPPKPRDWPSYILACDPDGWTGNYPVAYWQADWKDIIVYGRNRQPGPGRDYASALDELLLDGFDGIYLDWVEGYEDASVMAAARQAGVDSAAEMVELIREIRDYARSRQPGFLVVQQNAAALAGDHPELLGLIDAIAQEGVWYDGIATDDWEDAEGYDAPIEPDLTDYYTGHLQRYLDAGSPVFVCEYALRHAATAYANAYRHGYVPYVTRRSLGALTTTPPPAYE